MLTIFEDSHKCQTGLVMGSFRAPWRVVGAPRVRCKEAVYIMYFEAVFAVHFDNNTSTMYSYNVL